MLRLFYKNPTKQLVTTVTAETGIFLQQIDMESVYNLGDLAAPELEILTGSVAPGAGLNLNLNYAFSSVPNRTVAQLTPAAGTLACAIPSTGNTSKTYTAPVVYQGARYLYLWYDHDALPAGATLELTQRVSAKM